MIPCERPSRGWQYDTWGDGRRAEGEGRGRGRGEKGRGRERERWRGRERVEVEGKGEGEGRGRGEGRKRGRIGEVRERNSARKERRCRNGKGRGWEEGRG